MGPSGRVPSEPDDVTGPPLIVTKQIVDLFLGVLEVSVPIRHGWFQVCSECRDCSIVCYVKNILKCITSCMFILLKKVSFN